MMYPPPAKGRYEALGAVFRYSQGSCGRPAGTCASENSQRGGDRRGALDSERDFNDSGNMESSAVHTLSALAQESRLEVFRALARVAPAGLAAGVLADELGLPPSTLSFHLDHLLNAGLVRRERDGRSLVYSLDVGAVNDLIWFLGEDACQGNVALAVDPLARIRERTDAARARTGRPRVLFLCSRNSARSQMAEAILRREAGERFDVHSCGLRPAPIHPLALRVIEEAGLDASPLRSKDLGDFLGKVSIHHAIIVCEAASDHCPKLHPFALHLHHWPFPDPVAVEGTEEERLIAFREVRDALEERIRVWLREGLPVTGGRARAERLASSAPSGTDGGTDGASAPPHSTP